ncbi:hypothetical protein BJ508DRAFT_359155 [Ascobolus immersus RN42]|uniref:DUF890 domain protein n=1 Tax=Ascobolus immersus RN42 TaxID=1160509 RepID=A0A3N4IFX7_ASCIM|nr:hypothetical protein BJ508DRAFT_359155 [Ascobolus immersus RN42]
MHPRSPYASSISFALLAERYPELKQYLIHNSHTIDFQNPAAVRCLSAALLKSDWNLDVDFGGKIVPGVPSRLNYILFLQDLLDSTLPRTHSTKPCSTATGLDIGTGASAIYPLLAVRSRPAWKMYATELDPTSLSTAAENVGRNRLEDKITVLPAETDGDSTALRVLPLDLLTSLPPDTVIDFTMCNPPFFDSSTPSAPTDKVLPAKAVCEATPSELSTPGGEVVFVTQMILESLRLRASSVKVRWFTTLLGHKASVEPLVNLLRENAVTNYAITRLTTGANWKGTVRWVLAWSFGEVRPPVEIARGGGITMKSFWPEVGELVIPGVGMKRVLEVIENLKSGVEVFKTTDKNEVWGWCERDVWSRKARRAMQRGEELRDDGGVGWRLVRVEEGMRVVWREGRDRVPFESWSGWVRREALKKVEDKEVVVGMEVEKL